HVLSMVVSVAGSQEAAPERRENFYRELMTKVRSVPGVESVGGINHLPLAGDIWGFPFTIEGRPKPKPGAALIGIYRVVMPVTSRRCGCRSSEDARLPLPTICGRRAWSS